MRLAMSVLFALMVAAVFAQPSPEKSLFATVRADAIIEVQLDQYGSDIVNITMMDPSYPPAVLNKQIKAIGAYLGSEPRGLNVYRYAMRANDPSSEYTKASFGVDGLIQREKGFYRILPFVKAFAGVSAPNTVHGISVIYSGMQPTGNTIHAYRSGSFRMEAQTSPGVGLEYRVALLSQDVEQISKDGEQIDRADPSQMSKQAGGKGGGKTFDWTLWGLIGVAALAAGALVYSLLLRQRPQARA